MKVREVIQEFIPCQVCGNRDVKNFYFHVMVDQGSQPFVKCCECEEEYFSARASKIINKIEVHRMEKVQISFIHKERSYAGGEKREYTHPLVNVLSHF